MFYERLGEENEVKRWNSEKIKYMCIFKYIEMYIDVYI